VDASTKEPLAGVSIRLDGTGLGAITQANGRYFLINVPAGTYSVTIESLGYGTIRREGVVIAIDQLRTLDFELTTQALAIQEVVVEAERVPLIDVNTTGSRDVVTAEEIAGLPATRVSDILALQHGYFEIPLDNADLVSFADQQRGISGESIRGSRMGENITLVDGIPVTNFISGDNPMNLAAIAVEQLDYARGGFDAQYGNALSGVVNIRTRTARQYYQGSLSFQSSAFGGLLGSRFDELRAEHNLDGFLSGPIPGTADKLMFVITASSNQSRGRPYQYDDHIFVPWLPAAANQYDTTSALSGHELDMIPGWRTDGFNRQRSLMGKLEYVYSPVARLTFQVTDGENKSGSGAWSSQRIGWDVTGQCVELYPYMEDMCRRLFLGGRVPEKLEDLRGLTQANQWVVQNSIARSNRLYAMNWNHTLPASRMAYTVSAGRSEAYRDACTIAAGLCFGERLGWLGQSGAFIGHSSFGSAGSGDRGAGIPVFGTARNTSGDYSISEYFSGNFQWQATDHHNLTSGFELNRHEIFNTESSQVGNNNIVIYNTYYGGQPWDAALHVQDRIEYDFVTLNLGLRFDYGRASGLFFDNPRDPTNGTTAFHVCRDPARFGLPADRFRFRDPETQEFVSGIIACSLDPHLMDVARDKAMEDDFREAKGRRALSPRIGISFPVTENSSVFFNYGRFTQNPRYQNLYRLTGIGTPVEGTRDALEFVQKARRAPLIGNAHLLQEQTTNYELGYVSSFAEGTYGFNATLYTRDQYNLTGSRQGGVDEFGRIIFDPGSTYRAPILDYNVLLNLDFSTARGVELTFRRRLENYWGFDVRYAYSQTRTNSAPAELELQRRLEGDRAVRREITSAFSRPHTGSMTLRFQVGNRAPDIPFGNLVRNTQLSFAGRYSSGNPYTPQLNSSGTAASRLERNSARGPAIYGLNMQANKRFQHANLSWQGFLRVDNVLNLQTCARVYPSTGRCDGGQLTRSRLVSAGEGTLQGASISTGAAGTNSQNWDHPDYYNAPRSISAGLTVSF
jgi:outer membrane receptor protein involved in Fe transport